MKRKRNSGISLILVEDLIINDSEVKCYPRKMSRGVRDLRDLICVSRLTFHESEDEEYFSEDAERISKEIGDLNVANGRIDSKISSPTQVASGLRLMSPDSGFVTNGSPAISSTNHTTASSDEFLSNDSVFITDQEKEDSTPRATPLAPGTARFKSQKKKRKKRNNGLPLEPTRHELPRRTPLPPVHSIPGSPIVSELEFANRFQRAESAEASQPKTRVNFDDMLTYMDATIVAGWLTRSNTAVEELTKFFDKGDNFVRFSHFWLSEFSDLQKRDIFTMEYDFLLEELTLAFAVGRENRSVVRRDLVDMCGAVFKEYPVKLLGAKGAHIFLDYLDVLSSERQEAYRKLLSDVRCSTSNRQFAQWLLATRSFALVTVWSSVINFYRNLEAEGGHGMPIHDLCSSKESIPHRRMLQAIRLGYIDVIHYLIVSGHVNPTHSDSHGRSLIFSAVMHNQMAVIKYLTTRVQPVINVNQPADTGNTALHAAANSGNFAMVEILCGVQGIDVNCVNPQCEKATPLHLAVMHGHEKIVSCLLQHGADATLKMGTTTVRDLARDFDHTSILEMLDTTMS